LHRRHAQLLGVLRDLCKQGASARDVSRRSELEQELGEIELAAQHARPHELWRFD
jgi:hypothetical protein